MYSRRGEVNHDDGNLARLHMLYMTGRNMREFHDSMAAEALKLSMHAVWRGVYVLGIGGVDAVMSCRIGGPRSRNGRDGAVYPEWGLKIECQKGEWLRRPISCYSCLNHDVFYVNLDSSDVCLKFRS